MTDSNNIGRAPVAKLDEASVPETPPQFRARRADPPRPVAQAVKLNRRVRQEHRRA